MSSSIISFFVTANPPGRLDKALSRDAPVSASLSRSRLRKLIEQGVVRVDGSVATHVDASVSEGQFVEIIVPQVKEIDNSPENIPLNIIYEDEYFDRWKNNLIVSTLASQELLRLVFNEQKKSLIYIENISINRRIRDIIKLDDGKIALLTDRGNIEGNVAKIIIIELKENE